MGSSLATPSGPSVRQSPRLARLLEHPERDALLTSAWLAASAAVDLGNRYFPEQPTPVELPLAEASAATAAGNAVVVLREGARTDEQRELVADLVVLAAARDFPSAPETELETTRRMVWLEAHTSLRLLTPLREFLGGEASALGAALARAAQPDATSREGEPGPAPRGELLVIAAALGAFPRELAARLPNAPSFLVSDEAAARLLAPVEAGPEGFVEGELGPPPRSPWLTVVLALTLWLFVSHGARLLGKVLLGYRTPARARLSPRGLELDAKTQLLGRTLKEKSLLVPLEQLAEVERETRFARAGLYAGLIALALGTYVGMGFLVDGLRAPGGSLTLIGWALLCIAAGVAADFALTSLGDGARGRCRLIIRPRQGRRFAVGKVDPARTEAMLERLVQALPAAPSA